MLLAVAECSDTPVATSTSTCPGSSPGYSDAGAKVSSAAGTVAGGRTECVGFLLV